MRKLLFVATLLMLGGGAYGLLRVPPRAARRLWTFALVAVLGGGVCMMSAHALVAKWRFRGDEDRFGLVLLMDGNAHRPFVYRRLAPELVRGATEQLLARLSPATVERLQASPLARYRAPDEEWSPRKAVAFHVAYALVWLALLGTLLVFAALLRACLGTPPTAAIAYATLAVALYPLSLVHGGYLYDAPEVLLWSALLWCALRGPTLLLPLLFLGMMANKESALIAVPGLLPILARRTGRWRALAWTGALGVIGLGWLWWIRQRYQANAGSPMEFWFWTNAMFWGDPTSYFRFDDLFAPWLPAPRGANVLTLLLVAIPVRFGWPRLRPDLRWAFALVAAVLVPLFVWSCFTDELRNLSLLAPFLLLLVAAGVQAMDQPGAPAGADHSARLSPSSDSSVKSIE